MLIFALLAVSLLLLIWNSTLLIRRTRARQPLQAAGWGLGSGLVLLFFSVTSLNLPGTPATVSAAPPPVPAATTTDRTPAQNLAILADRDPNDPGIAALLARLDAACPENGSVVADIVVNLQQLVSSKSGRTLSIEEVMTQLINAQEGPAQESGMTCPETGGMLATLLIEGM